jgi:predicted DNA-binding transcriptional regulator AlpA
MSTTVGPMMIDTDDLVDATEVAELLGLSSGRAISVYRARYDDFPEPVVVKAKGRLLLWRRQDVRLWGEGRG